jgi:hypothetical protein
MLILMNLIFWLIVSSFNTQSLKAFATSSFTFEIDPSRVSFGDYVSVHGTTDPPGTVTLLFFKPSGSNFTVDIISDGAGRYNYSFIPEELGYWNVRASFLGMATEKGFAVVGTSSVSLWIIPSEPSVGNEATVRGSISLNPPANWDSPSRVIIYVYSSGNLFDWEYVNVDSYGNFSYKFTPNTTGNWTAYAEWGGDYVGGMDKYYDGSSSPNIMFQVIPEFSSVLIMLFTLLVASLIILLGMKKSKVFTK